MIGASRPAVRWTRAVCRRVSSCARGLPLSVTEVLGLRDTEFVLAPRAAALPAGLELRTSGYGRGERSRTASTDLKVPTVTLRIQLVGIERWLRTA
jgi:hypothetical protein